MSAVLLLDVSWSKEIKEVELNKSKDIIHNNTFIQRNSHEDSLSVNKVQVRRGLLRIIIYQGVRRRKRTHN